MSRRVPRIASIAIAVSCASLVLAGTASAADRTVYVAPSGSDDAPGTMAKPLRTVRAGLWKTTAGGRVFVAPGQYEATRDDFARTGSVRVVSSKPGAATIRSLAVAGGQRVSYEGFKFSAGFTIGDHPTLKQRQTASDVSIINSDITTPTNYMCSVVRNGAQRIRIVNNSFHDCKAGVVGVGNAPTSRSITITDNTIHRMTADGIQFANWDDVTIARNDIRDIYDPNKKEHNDAIQVMGAAHRVRIIGNTLFGTAGQLIFMQEDLGQVDDVRLEGNVMAQTTGFAIQSIGISKAVFLGNTIWDAKLGGLLLKPGKTDANGNVDLPNDTVVVNNLMSTYVEYNGARAATRSGNFIRCSAPKATLSGVTCVSDPGFVDAPGRDYRLAAGSPVVNAAGPYPAGSVTASGLRRGASRSPGGY